MGVEELLAVIVAVLRAECLIFSVHGFREAAQQRVILVTREKSVPFRAPQHLDHVPTCADEQSLQLLDYLAVSAHGPVKPLQVAVDDEG